MAGPLTARLLEAVPRIGPKGYDPYWDDIDRGMYGVRYYDREGQPITMREWVMLREHVPDYFRVAWDEIGPYHVSTVWLGLNHGFGRSVPIIFESMVFSNELSFHKPGEYEGIPFGGFYYHQDFDQRRYSTEAQALAGHQELCEQIRAVMAATEGLDPRIEGVGPSPGAEAGQ